MDATRIFETLAEQNGPAFFADCCCGISLQLLDTLVTRLPAGLALSVGCGTGLLEALLYRKSGDSLHIRGVEVPSCVNKYLPHDRVYRVSSTTSVAPDAVLAEVAAILFVYPRTPSLIAAYLQGLSGVRGALQSCQKVFYIANRVDWASVAPIFDATFATVEVLHCAGLPEYEILAVGSSPKL